MIKYDNTIAKAETFTQLHHAIQAVAASYEAGFVADSTYRDLMVAVARKLRELGEKGATL